MPATITVRVTGPVLAACLERSLQYGEALAKDIPVEKFAHVPHPGMNHPAFVYGHLSSYPNRILSMLGREREVVEKAGWEDLFRAGVECVDDPKRYPPKDEIMPFFSERYRAILAVLPEVPDETFARENPAQGRLREMFPTIGIATNFMMNNHLMMHLGQVSAWRRAIGLGRVF